MNLFLHRTQSYIDVDDETENKHSLIPIDGANELGEEEEQTGSELTINIERASKKCRKDFNKFQKGDKEGVDKILTFLKDKNMDKKQAGELDFFFASACEGTKRLPRHLRLKVKAEVMKAVIIAENECLDHEQFRSPTPSINCEIAGCSSRTTPSPARQTSTPSPAYPQSSTPSPFTPFYPSTCQNQAQENTGCIKMIVAVLKLIIFTSMVNRIINSSINERVTQQVYDIYLQMFDVCTLRHTAHIKAIVQFLPYSAQQVRCDGLHSRGNSVLQIRYAHELWWHKQPVLHVTPKEIVTRG